MYSHYGQCIGEISRAAEGHIWGLGGTRILLKGIIYQMKAEDVRLQKIHDAGKSGLCGLRNQRVSMVTIVKH